MAKAVDISFDCFPLRMLSRIDCPWDAPDEYRELLRRVRQAAERHGQHNTYYLYNGLCTFQLTNDTTIGTLQFAFEGVVFTGADDLRAVGEDLQIELVKETCDWLTTPIVEWFTETVRRAVMVEFDRFIEATDPQKARQRLEKLEQEIERRKGFLGMGL